MIRLDLQQDGSWKLPRKLLRAGILEVLRAEGVGEGELSVTFLGDPGMQALNREYLGRDRPTDVLAFTLEAPAGGMLGDVYVGYDQGLRQAREMGIDPHEELLRLAIHGVLHVLGPDHPEGAGREGSPMFLRQEELLAGILSRGRG